MKRELYNSLLAWRDDKERKPLIIRGARQVGKTYLLEEFGRNQFSQTIRLNFEKQPRLKSIFQKDLVVERIIREIEIEFDLKIEPSTTLILFDEVQECPGALTSLKYFCESQQKYFIASAGSLLGLKTHEGSFPVGKVHFLNLFPLNFHEFLMGLGENELASFLAGLAKIEPISDGLHQKCIDYLKLYFCVGGMPEVVKQYIEKRDFNIVREVQADLLETYSNDFSKHAGKTAAMRIQQLWDAIPAQLASEQKRFMLSGVKKGARFKDYEEAILWLTKTMLCHKIQLIKRPEFPLAHFAQEGLFKLMPLDVGLISAMSTIPIKVILQESDLFKIFKGAVTESFVGQELVSLGRENLYYWRSEHQAEVDYLIELGEHIYPIEVKSGESGKLKSLKVYSEKYSPRYRIRISANNFYSSGDFINLPLYGIKQLAQHGAF